MRRMSVTFKLKKNAKFHNRDSGRCQGRQVVARPRRQRRRLSDLPDGRGLADQAGTIRCRRRQYGADHFAKKDRLTISDLAVIVPCVINSAIVIITIPLLLVAGRGASVRRRSPSAGCAPADAAPPRPGGRAIEFAPTSRAISIDGGARLFRVIAYYHGR